MAWRGMILRRVRVTRWSLLVWQILPVSWQGRGQRRGWGLAEWIPGEALSRCSRLCSPSCLSPLVLEGFVRKLKDFIGDFIERPVGAALFLLAILYERCGWVVMGVSSLVSVSALVLGLQMASL